MLKKFINIKKIGRFHSSALGGDTSLSKYSFISGANAFGKTTLCAILRSAKTGEAGYVIGRKTAGYDGVATVELLTNTGTIRFNGSTWDATKPEIAIFDSEFIAENVPSLSFITDKNPRVITLMDPPKSTQNTCQTRAIFS